MRRSRQTRARSALEAREVGFELLVRLDQIIPRQGAVAVSRFPAEDRCEVAADGCGHRLIGVIPVHDGIMEIRHVHDRAICVEILKGSAFVGLLALDPGMLEVIRVDDPVGAVDPAGDGVGRSRAALYRVE